jgi:hypothetical protein
MRAFLRESTVTILIAAVILIAVALLGIVTLGLPLILAMVLLFRQAGPSRPSEPRVLIEAGQVAATAWRRDHSARLLAGSTDRDG